MNIQNTNNEFSIPVDHVSDTAYLVAAYRILESKRPDRYFNDALAPQLVGKKGEELLAQFSSWKLGEWMMAVRTTLIDRLLLKAVKEGVDTIVNLAAGLDTRPYRLDLPKTLHWIEADFEGIIQHKNKKLENEKTVCQLKRVQVNLADPEEQSKFFATFKTLGRFVVLTEGLLLYLRPEDVYQLSKDLLSYSNLHSWMMDITTKKSFSALQNFSDWNAMHGSEDKSVQFKFLPEEGVHFFEPLGWHIKEYQSYCEYGQQINRNLPDSLQITDVKSLSGMGLGVLTRQV